MESKETRSAPRGIDVPPPTGEPRADALRLLLAVVDRLRDPDGCPWDRAQTLATVAPHLVEEAHEVQEAIETGADAHVAEEAGDLLMGIFLLARIAEQERRFDLAQVASGVAAKLVRRHPHVFGEKSAGSPAEALASWEAVKRAERAAKAEDTSALAGVPQALPALQRARRLGEKALSAGFRWSDARGALAKVEEEVRELQAAFVEHAAAQEDEVARARLEHELGDVLIATAFLGNYVGIDPERALRQALRRFDARFRSMEAELGVPLATCSLEQMLAAWRSAKGLEQ
jgi:MazG family protein